MQMKYLSLSVTHSLTQSFSCVTGFSVKNFIKQLLWCIILQTTVLLKLFLLNCLYYIIYHTFFNYKLYNVWIKFYAILMRFSIYLTLQHIKNSSNYFHHGSTNLVWNLWYDPSTCTMYIIHVCDQYNHNSRSWLDCPVPAFLVP